MPNESSRRGWRNISDFETKEGQYNKCTKRNTNEINLARKNAKYH